APAVFHRFLRRWQHVETGTRLHGLRGLEAILDQMQGFEAPASAWEPHLLSARVADYQPEMLDQLCLSGTFAWARLVPAGGKRTAPTRNSPISFYRRAEAGWLLPAAGWSQANVETLSAPAAAVYARLRERGASFFNDLVHGSLLKSQVEDALWELVAAGRATADGFDNLRAFLDAKRRGGEGRGQYARPRHSPGRWALIQPAGQAQPVFAGGGGCAAMERSSVPCWPANPAPSPGTRCCWPAAAWRPGARSAAAASSPASPASSMRCRKRWRHCARCGSCLPANRPRAAPPIRSTWRGSFCPASAFPPNASPWWPANPSVQLPVPSCQLPVEAADDALAARWRCTRACPGQRKTLLDEHGPAVFAGGCAPGASHCHPKPQAAWGPRLWSAPLGRDGIGRVERQAGVFPRRRNGAWKETPFLGLDLASGEATRPSPRHDDP